MLWGTGDASTLHHILTVTWRIILVLLGVNALIIVHEFGHFVVARLCGVRCDKFYIWFDAYDFRFFRFKWGQTEYGLGWLPLGGYVKMLGQEDNPGGIKEEIERAKRESEKSPEAKKLLEEKEKEAKDLYAPDSYLSKNVFQRMAIISAGVIMNVLFAVICATFAFMLGFPEATSRIGSVLPSSPAWTVGLLPGDKVVALDGKPSSLFADITLAILDREPVVMTIEREQNGTVETIEKTVTPMMKKGQMTPLIGVSPSSSLNLTLREKAYSTTLDEAENERLSALFAAVPARSRLVAMNGEEVRTPADYQKLARKNLTKPIRFEFAETDKKGNLIEGGKRGGVELPPEAAAETGIRLTMGEITALADGSVGAGAGLKKQVKDATGEIVEHGDIPTAINNEPILDPLAFPFQIYQLASQSAGPKEILLTVKRNGESVDVPLSITEIPGYSGQTSFNGNLACQEIGISFEVLPVISGTDAGVTFSSDARPIGSLLDSIQFSLAKPGKDASKEIQQRYGAILHHGKKTKSGGFLYKIGSPEPEEAQTKALFWFAELVNQLPTGTPLKIESRNSAGDKFVLETTVTRPGTVQRIDRNIQFDVNETKIAKAKDFETALALGWNKTIDSMGLIYRQLKNIGRNISVKAFGGPVMIVDLAYRTTGTGDGTFLLFLCLIGANLAVINLLPIPVLDGGHLVFLLYEMIFRRPPNENIQIILSYIGLFLILGLMVWVIFLDVARIFGLM